MDDEAAPSLAEGLSREDAWLDSADKSEWTGTEHRLELAHKGIQLQIPGSADYTKLADFAVGLRRRMLQDLRQSMQPLRVSRTFRSRGALFQRRCHAL